MKTNFARLERKKALALARYYKSKGYKVLSLHAGVKLTPKIAGVRPDIVARKGGKTVIIEVKSNESLQGSFRTLTKLSNYAEKMPGHRFDIVVTNPPFARGFATSGSNPRSTEKSGRRKKTRV